MTNSGADAATDHGKAAAAHEVDIILNGEPALAPTNMLSFETILGLLPDYDANYHYRVDYEKAAQNPNMGELSAGQSVKVHKGTIIHATPTDKS